MNATKAILLVATVTTILTGCVTGNTKTNAERLSEAYSTPYKSRSELSYASNILKAGHIYGIRDTDQSKTAKVSSTEKYSLGLVSVVSSTVNNTFEVGNLSSGLLSFASFIGKKNDPAARNHIIVWDESPFHIPTYYKGLVDRLSSQEEFKGTLVPYEMVLRKSISINGLKHVGPGCADPLVENDFLLDCGIMFSVNTDPNWSGRNRDNYGTAKAAYPDFLGEGNKSGYILKMPFHVAFKSIGAKSVSVEADMLEGFVNLSKELSAHSYIYLAPGKYTVRNKEGVLMSGGIPILLNKGSIHTFTKPAA